MPEQPGLQADPRYHTTNIRHMLGTVIHHAREDAAKVQDPRARQLFETTADVLEGLVAAYARYETAAAEAMREA